MLTGRFPHVQFILSAHNPLIVAGCDRGEVAVLRAQRPTSTRFSLERLDRDFIGTSSRELYELLFEVDDVDRTYLEFATKLTAGVADDNQREIDRLLAKKTRTPEDNSRADALLREQRLISRVAEIRQVRLMDDATRIEELEREVSRLRDDLRRKERPRL